ncbi:hypothetical protein Cgig2_022271 [Carnegiea gigantea]|uniref:N-alpha-acetyltransferase 40 n=1 Tax=Carnegiea gigantea TaxID=171969 RepID=A0A9Q1QJY5_9CARY|nr:hypothetical protein Cgig2_022271 [Carnegiea gigantea]
MERHYGTEWPMEEKVKNREMVAPDACYIFAYEVPTLSRNDEMRLITINEHVGDVVGFAHYRFILEEELPVLYVYELQLEQHVQGKGVGKFLMQLLELIARKSCMAAIMLTVQKANLSAMLFYANKMNYCVSAISPSRVDPMVWSDQLWKRDVQSIIEVEKVVATCQRWRGFAFEYSFLPPASSMERVE